MARFTKILYKKDFNMLRFDFSDCWMINGKPVLFRIKRLRHPDYPKVIHVSIVFLYMIAIHFAFEGEIK